MGELVQTAWRRSLPILFSPEGPLAGLYVAQLPGELARTEFALQARHVGVIFASVESQLLHQSLRLAGIVEGRGPLQIVLIRFDILDGR